MLRSPSTSRPLFLSSLLRETAPAAVWPGGAGTERHARPGGAGTECKAGPAVRSAEAQRCVPHSDDAVVSTDASLSDRQVDASSICHAQKTSTLSSRGGGAKSIMIEESLGIPVFAWRRRSDLLQVE